MSSGNLVHDAGWKRSTPTNCEAAGASLRVKWRGNMVDGLPRPASFAPKLSWTQMGGWHRKIDHSSGFPRSFGDLAMSLCTSFYGGSNYLDARSQKICLRQVLVSPRFSWMGQNFENDGIS